MNNHISSIRPLPMQYGDQQSEAYRTEFERRRARQVCQDKPVSLSTHYSASEFEESSNPIVWADEIDPLPKIARQHRKDSKVAVGMVWLFAFCVVAALLKWKFGL
jgi:hypothetical protein